MEVRELYIFVFAHGIESGADKPYHTGGGHMEEATREKFAVFITPQGKTSVLSMQVDSATLRMVIERTLQPKQRWDVISNLLPVGVRITIPLGECVDVLAIDASKNMIGIIFDLETPRPIVVIVGRAVAIAAWLEGLSYKEVQQIAREWWSDATADLASIHRACFGEATQGSSEATSSGDSFANQFNQHPRVIILTTQTNAFQELHRYFARKGIAVEIAQLQLFSDADGNAVIFVERLGASALSPHPVGAQRREVLGAPEAFLSSLTEAREGEAS
ncbi:MAG TPA: hypothetical protein EYP10_15425 [Armatimonadetes bacterium]|nr:hypothetical protein [Armatimonadota bacterium]